MMRAILIDPAACAINEIAAAGGEAGPGRAAKKAVGGYIEAACGWRNGDILYVDEEGRLKGQPRGWFRIVGSFATLAGNGVVLGTDRSGKSRDARSTIRHLAGLVTWATPVAGRA